MAADRQFAPRESCLGEDEALRYVSSSGEAEPDLAVQGHLDSCPPCRMMIAEASRAMSEDAARPRGPGLRSAPAPTSLAVGEVLLGRYTIVAFVARGGMGEVYEAYDDLLKEIVALKTLVSTDLDRPEAVQRLMAEVRLARQVTHPNVCRIYEFGMHVPAGRQGRDPEPIPFLTMEFLRGETLDRRLARLGRFAPDEVLRLIPQMTAGLEAMHAAGVVHRDIKPANLSLLPGPPDRLVLMDLGLARSASPAETGRSLSGGSGGTGGRLVGTIDYMAPEQLGGQPATRAVDIYALGLVIFEMLTGRRPFTREDPLAAALERMSSPPPRPTDLVAGLDPAWDTLLGRCLTAERERRLASAEELAAHARAAFGQPRPSPPALARAMPRSRLALLALSVLGLGAAATAAGVALTRGRSSDLRGGQGGVVIANAKPLRPAAYRPQRSFGARGCSEEMVRIGDRFCIDRYEAVAVDDVQQRSLVPFYPPSPDLVTKVLEDWQRRVEGGTTGLPVPLPELPAWQREVGWRPQARSQAGVLPQGYATQIIAAVACSGAGKRLCTTEEWRLACRGERDTKFPYGETFQEGVCNVRRAEHPAEMLKIDYTDGQLDPRMNQLSSERSGPLLHLTGANPGCASRWGDDAVYDMVGNLDEWSADPNGVLLGGFYSRQTEEGCDHTNRKHGPDYFNYSLGIRCCDRLR